ncbi:hypothetical protein FG386_000181 [Cryptosporidium ryanae]|uniref:uncharacterized protein n=1 Tax=Cryptosporidium ryanae TaxID=515981 RepID=UPI003519FF9D|nr:hypothetical protein FG386_000181 [Cryptosporidium ryanae]
MLKKAIYLCLLLLVGVLAELKDKPAIEETEIQRNLRVTPFNISAMLFVSLFTLLIIFIVGLAMDTDTPTKFEEKAPQIMKEY